MPANSCMQGRLDAPPDMHRVYKGCCRLHGIQLPIVAMCWQLQHATLPAAVPLSTAWPSSLVCSRGSPDSNFTLRLMSASVVKTMNLPNILFQEKPGKENLHSQQQANIGSQHVQS